MTSISRQEFYTVQVMVKAQPSLTNAPAHLEWLCVDSDYASHTTTESRAKQFDHIPDAKEIAGYDGMPWMSAHDGRFKPRVFKTTVTTEKELIS